VLDERGGACHCGPRRMDDAICQYIAVRRATCYMPSNTFGNGGVREEGGGEAKDASPPR